MTSGTPRFSAVRRRLFPVVLFRTINAVIAGAITAELWLNASHLGLMTSVYFLTFAGLQLPLGILLDRYGPRRVQSGLLLVVAASAARFAAADRFETLVLQCAPGA